jgi:hypothetical protein
MPQRVKGSAVTSTAQAVGPLEVQRVQICAVLCIYRHAAERTGNNYRITPVVESHKVTSGFPPYVINLYRSLRMSNRDFSSACCIISVLKISERSNMFLMARVAAKNYF